MVVSLRDQEWARTLEAWATISVDRPERIYHWAPPVPLIITGFHFSEPVRVSQVRRHHDLIAISAEERRNWRRDAKVALLPDSLVTDIELTASLMIGEEMLVLLHDDSRAAATIRWSNQALQRFLADTEAQRKRDG
jgi:hypothetical protein